jgi:hypothetical protein
MAQPSVRHAINDNHHHELKRVGPTSALNPIAVLGERGRKTAKNKNTKVPTTKRLAPRNKPLAIHIGDISFTLPRG